MSETVRSKPIDRLELSDILPKPPAKRQRLDMGEEVASEVLENDAALSAMPGTGEEEALVPKRVDKDIPSYGNYRNYYKKQKSGLDARLSLIPQDWIDGKRVLDIGCNR